MLRSPAASWDNESDDENGESVRVRFRRELGFEAQIRTEEPFLTVRWTKPAPDYQI